MDRSESYFNSRPPSSQWMPRHPRSGQTPQPPTVGCPVRAGRVASGQLQKTNGCKPSSLCMATQGDLRAIGRRSPLVSRDAHQRSGLLVTCQPHSAHSPSLCLPRRLSLCLSPFVMNFITKADHRIVVSDGSTLSTRHFGKVDGQSRRTASSSRPMKAWAQHGMTSP